MSITHTEPEGATATWDDVCAHFVDVWASRAAIFTDIETGKRVLEGIDLAEAKALAAKGLARATSERDAWTARRTQENASAERPEGLSKEPGLLSRSRVVPLGKT